MSNESHVFIESFFKWDDASAWLDKHLEEYRNKEDFEVLEARIAYINHQWRAGCTFGRKQMELSFG